MAKELQQQRAKAQWKKEALNAIAEGRRFYFLFN